MLSKKTELTIKGLDELGWRAMLNAVEGGKADLLSIEKNTDDAGEKEWAHYAGKQLTTAEKQVRQHLSAMEHL